MKNIITMMLCVIVLGIADIPIFDDPVPIEANGSPINVGYGGNASPFMVDWDGDSRQDLLLGQYDGGKVRFYSNTGSHYNPTFGNFEYLQADGADISVSYG